MDFSTIVLAVLAVGASSLAIVIGLAHRDMLAAIVRMDRSATAAEHAARALKRQRSRPITPPTPDRYGRASQRARPNLHP